MLVASVFLLGDAIGRIHQLLKAGNVSPGNSGVPFYTGVICPLLAIVLLLFEKRRSRRMKLGFKEQSALARNPRFSLTPARVNSPSSSAPTASSGRRPRTKELSRK